MAKGKKNRFISLSNLSELLLLNNLPYIFFVGFLATIYIANVHYAEKKIREIQVLQQEQRQLRYHYMTLKSEQMYKSKQSEVAKMVEPLGLMELRERPKKIIVAKDGYKE